MLLCGNIVYGNNQDIYNAVSCLEEYEDIGQTPEELADISAREDNVQEALERMEKTLDKYLWVSVTERLPKLGERVLVDSNGLVLEAYRALSKGKEEWFRYGIVLDFTNDNGERYYPITSWRPLPETGNHVTETIKKTKGA